MGRVKEQYLEEERIRLERLDAAYWAVPEALHQNLEIGRSLQESHDLLRQENTQLRELLNAMHVELKIQAGPWEKWKERIFGFVIGIAASVVASYVYLQLAKNWPLFR